MVYARSNHNIVVLCLRVKVMAEANHPVRPALWSRDWASSLIITHALRIFKINRLSSLLSKLNIIDKMEFRLVVFVPYTTYRHLPCRLTRVFVITKYRHLALLSLLHFSHTAAQDTSAAHALRPAIVVSYSTILDMHSSFLPHGTRFSYVFVPLNTPTLC
jgi:hypothetical protein